MSASEKLKVFEREPGLHRDALEDALPQIVAVVEAAEVVTPPDGHEVVGPYEYVRGDELYAIRDALSALDEALP